MKNRRIEVKLGRTINMGDYESARVDVGLVADVLDDKEFNDAANEVYDEVKKLMVVYSKTITDSRDGKSSRRRRR